MQKYILLMVISLGVLVLLSPFITALETSNPSPIIHVDYSSIDANVNIASATLTFPSGFIMNLGYDTKNGYDYTFPVNSFLFPGTYHFRIIAEDNDKNRITTEDDLKILESPGSIWVSEPKIPYFLPQTQNIAIGQKIPFKLEVDTKIPSICRIKRYHPPLSEDPEAIFLSAGFTYFNNDPNSLSITHQVEVKPASQAKELYEIPLTNPFDYKNLNLGTFIVVCKQESVEGQTNYLLKKIYLGYDSTKPDFTVSFNPSVIEDEYGLETKMNIQTKNDLVACSYKYTVNPEPKQDDTQGELPQFHKITSITNYSRNITKIFRFLGKAFDLNKDYIFNLTIDCHNPAQLHTIKKVSYKVHLTRNLSVNLENNYFSTSNPELNFTSNLHSICSYQFQNDSGVINSKPSTSHSVQLKDIKDGTYEIKIHCETVGVGGLIDKTFKFKVSATKPEPPVLSGTTNTCGSSKATLEIEPNSSKYVVYNISLYQGDDLIKNEIYPSIPTNRKVDYSISVKALNKTTYTWKVIAIDRGKLESDEVDKTFQKTDYNETVCDITPPQAKLNITETKNGFEVSITCIDKGSGCQDHFNFKKVGLEQACDYTSLNQMSYADLPLTFTENKKLCYQIIDKAGNTLNSSKQIKASFEITVAEPKFGIANSKTFNLEVKTSRQATCKQGYQSQKHYDKITDWYNSLYPFDTENQNRTDHNVSLNSNQILQLNSNQDKSTTTWVVICNASGLLQSKTINPFGFDTTPPIITVNAEPNPVIEAGLLETTLKVKTDDKTVCTYTDMDGLNRPFNNYDVNNLNSYTQNHDVKLIYSGIHNLTLDSKTIKCRNLAQLHSSTQFTIKINPENKINITINNPDTTQTKQFDLNATTQQLAECEYGLSTSEEREVYFNKMSQTGSHNHIQAVNLKPGFQTYDIKCEGLTSGDKGVATTKILFDDEKPKVSVQTNEQTCSLKKIKFNILTSDKISGIDHCEYKIKLNNSIIIDKNTTERNIEEQTNLKEGESITIEVGCVDHAGNKGSSTITTTASKYTAENCDTTPPDAKIDFKPVWGGYEATVSCDDNEQCADNFTYYLSPTHKCEEDKKSESSYDKKIMINSSETLCYTIYDSAGNKYEGSKSFFVEKNCFNGIEDPDEKGVDCGGPCLANCGTCNNNILDPFEKGVDCGGVCQTIHKCNSTSNSQTFYPNYNTNTTTNTNTTNEEEKPECQTTADCKIGYYCNYKNKCELDPTYQPETKNPYEQTTNNTNSGQLVAKILIFLGLIFMVGGSYYIYYSKNQKQQSKTFQKTQSMMVSRTEHSKSIQEDPKKKEELKKRLEELKQQHLKQEEALKKKLSEKKQKRKSLLDAFEIPESEKEKYSVMNETKNNSPKKENSLTNSEQQKNNKKFEEPQSEEFIDVRDLAKNPLIHKKEKVSKADKNTSLSELDELTKTINSDSRKKPNNEDDETKKEQKPEDSLSELEKLTGETKNKTPPVKEKTGKQEKTNQEDDFKALEKMISTTGGTTNKTTEKLISSTELMNMFEKEKIHIDVKTLLSTLNILLEEKKITSKIAKDVLKKMSERNLIRPEEIETLYQKLIN